MKKKNSSLQSQLILLIYSITSLVFIFLIAFRVSWLKDTFNAGSLWYQWGILSLSFLLLHYCLYFAGFRGNPCILPCTYVLSMFGFIILTRFHTFIIMGLPGFTELIYFFCIVLLGLTFWVSRGHGWLFIRKYYLNLSVVSFILASLLIVAGSQFRGAHFGPAMTTPTEIFKITFPLFLAGFFNDYKNLLSRERRRKKSGLGKLAAIVIIGLGIPFGIVFYQNDFGMLLLLACCLIVMTYISTGNKRILIFSCLVAILLFTGMLNFSAHGKNRLLAFWTPWSDPAGKGWQTIQSIFAINNGGLIGTGLGRGKPEAIPIVESDFIYAALAEELGLIGSACILIFFYIFFKQNLMVIRIQKDRFRYLFASGLNVLLITQVFINVGGVTRLLPITGMTLPFISRGGSSLFISYCIAGLFLSLSEPGKKTRK